MTSDLGPVTLPASHCKSLDEIEATPSIKVTVETPEVLGVKKGQ